MKINRKYKRKYLAAASAYRRQARGMSSTLDFSASALNSQYRHESLGDERPDPKVNGYTLGKWILDANLKMMKEDFLAGLITKFELKQGSSAFVRRQVDKWLSTTWYPYELGYHLSIPQDERSERELSASRPANP